jgi:hypothetical protein
LTKPSGTFDEVSGILDPATFTETCI